MNVLTDTQFRVRLYNGEISTTLYGNTIKFPQEDLRRLKLNNGYHQDYSKIFDPDTVFKNNSVNHPQNCRRLYLLISPDGSTTSVMIATRHDNSARYFYTTCRDKQYTVCVEKKFKNPTYSNNKLVLEYMAIWKIDLYFKCVVKTTYKYVRNRSGCCLAIEKYINKYVFNTSQSQQRIEKMSHPLNMEVLYDIITDFYDAKSISEEYSTVYSAYSKEQSINKRYHIADDVRLMSKTVSNEASRYKSKIIKYDSIYLTFLNKYRMEIRMISYLDGNFDINRQTVNEIEVHIDAENKMSYMRHYTLESIIDELNSILKIYTKIGCELFREITSYNYKDITKKFKMYIHTINGDVCYLCGSDIKDPVVIYANLYKVEIDELEYLELLYSKSTGRFMFNIADINNAELEAALVDIVSKETFKNKNNVMAITMICNKILFKRKRRK